MFLCHPTILIMLKLFTILVSFWNQLFHLLIKLSYFFAHHRGWLRSMHTDEQDEGSYTSTMIWNDLCIRKLFKHLSYFSSPYSYSVSTIIASVDHNISVSCLTTLRAPVKSIHAICGIATQQAGHISGKSLIFLRISNNYCFTAISALSCVPVK